MMGELSCNEVHDGGFGKCEPINTCLSTRPIVEVCVLASAHGVLNFVVVASGAVPRG